MNFAYSQIFPQEVREQLERDHPTQIVDVREPWEYERGHIPQALLMPMGEFAARCRTELATDQEIVLICEHGVRSESAAQYLASLGYEHVATMTGGMSRYAGPIEEGTGHAE